MSLVLGSPVLTTTPTILYTGSEAWTRVLGLVRLASSSLYRSEFKEAVLERGVYCPRAGITGMNYNGNRVLCPIARFLLSQPVLAKLTPTPTWPSRPRARGTPESYIER